MGNNSSAQQKSNRHTTKIVSQHSVTNPTAIRLEQSILVKNGDDYSLLTANGKTGPALSALKDNFYLEDGTLRESETLYFEDGIDGEQNWKNTPLPQHVGQAIENCRARQTCPKIGLLESSATQPHELVEEVEAKMAEDAALANGAA